MRHAVNKIDVAWGYLSQILNIGSSLLILPFVLSYLSPEDIGIWYVFIAMIGLVQLLEFGFLPTISRYISYIYSGAREISSDDIVVCNANVIDYQLLSNIIHSSRKIYLIVSVLAAVAIVTLGVLYLSSLNYVGDKKVVYLSWIVYGLSTILQFYFGYYNAILKGRGDQTLLNKIVVVSKVANITLTIPLLYCGFGLASVSMGVFFSAIIDRYLVRKTLLSKGDIKDALSLKHNDNKYVAVIWSKAKLMGIVQIGNFLTTRCSVFIVSSFIGLTAAAQYGFVLQLTSVAIIVASMYFGLQIPRFSSDFVSNNIESSRKILSQSIVISWVLFSAYGILLIVLGPFLIQFISSGVKLLPTPMLIVFLITSLLEMNHSICTAFLTTRNRFDFTIYIFATGVAISVFSYIFGREYGLWGVLLSPMCCQLFYNNWKWPLVVFQELYSLKNR